MPGRSIAGALPSLEFAFNELNAKTKPLGIVWQIADFGGLRTKADTTTIMRYRDADYAVWAARNPKSARAMSKSKWRPIAPWGKSMHNYGAAFDVEIVTAPPGMSRLQALNIVKDFAPSLQMHDGRDFGDPPHFELNFGVPPGGQALQMAKTEWQRHSGTDFFRPLPKTLTALR